MWSNNLKDLLGKLFTKNPNERMKNIVNIKAHPWFAGLDWEKLAKREVKPLFVPVIHN
jgi:hypothetical protein